MKIEFIKEFDADNEAYYFTSKDDSFVYGSLRYDYEKAKHLFDCLVKKEGELKENKEILESIFI